MKLFFLLFIYCSLSCASDIVIIQSVFDNLVLDVNHGVAEGKRVVLWDKGDAKWQRWIIDKDLAFSQKPTRFQSLDQDGGRIKGLDEDVPTATLQVWGFHGGRNQNWYFQNVSDGIYLLVNEHTKRCAFNHGRANQLLTKPCNSGDPRFQWRVEILTEPKETLQEHWWEHDQNVSRVFLDNDVAIYFNNEMPRSITWMNKFTGDVWRYTKQSYGNFGPNGLLFGIFHQGKYEGAHSGYFHNAKHGNRNTFDIGQSGSWEKAEVGIIDTIVHEIAYVVENTFRGFEGSPARGIWETYKWSDIFKYDVYKGIGMHEEADRIFKLNIDKTDNFPNPRVNWFRDWWMPIYSNHGETQVLVRFHEMLTQHFPKKGFEYQGRMNMGEFVHFWSGAARSNLKSTAQKAFQWTDQFETEFNDARAKFPGIIY